MDQPKPRRKLAALELARFVAAFWVVLHHICQRLPPSNPVIVLFQRTGSLPVMLFFILSGFVIGLSWLDRKGNFKEYFLARFKRIYPIFLFALVFSGLFGIAQMMLPLGASWTTYQQHQFEAVSSSLNLPTFLGNAFMLQGPKSSPSPGCFMPFAGNGPLWSLSFEWWFYMGFWLLSSWNPGLRSKYVVCVAGIGAAVGFCLNQNTIVLVPATLTIWWAGVELAREYRLSGRFSWPFQWLSGSALALQTIILFIMKKVWEHVGPTGQQHADDVTTVFYWFAFALAVWLVAIIGQKLIQADLGRFEKTALRLGALSYALYATHFVVLDMASHFRPHDSPMILAFAILPCLMLADILEQGYQKFAAALLNRLWPLEA